MSEESDLKILFYTYELGDKNNEFKGIFESIEIAIKSYVMNSNNTLAKNLKESGYYILAEKAETDNKYKLFYKNDRNGAKGNIGYLRIEDVIVNKVY